MVMVNRIRLIWMMTTMVFQMRSNPLGGDVDTDGDGVIDRLDLDSG